jgi:hypothetical protein
MRSTIVIAGFVLVLALAAHAQQVAPVLLNASGPELTLPEPPRPVLAAAIAPAPPEPAPPKVIDRKFVSLAALVFGLTVADVELTQHCLNAGTCYELNPTLPRSHWGQYAVNSATNAAVMYFAYRRRASGKWGWWVAPVVDIGAHSVGVGSNLRFAW